MDRHLSSLFAPVHIISAAIKRARTVASHRAQNHPDEPRSEALPTGDLVGSAVRTRIASLLFAAAVSLPAAADDGMWVGRYSENWLEGSAEPGGELLILRSRNADPATVSDEPYDDLARWVVSSSEMNRMLTLRRFYPDEYEGLETTSPAKCLRSDYITVCQVRPGTTVSFDGGGPVPEVFNASTGYFGILVRNGSVAFELKKLASTPLRRD